MPKALPHPLRCRCGRLRAQVLDPHRGTRAVCYCRDCQAFAHFLGPPEGMLDPLGGTDIVALRPRQVVFTSGVENLACMSLSPKGTLRWYAGCCNTPVGNTPRDRKVSHVGLVHSCLDWDGADMDTSFGAVVMRVNAQSARGTPPKASMVGFLGAVGGYLGSLLWSRISGQYRANPFFDATGNAPRVAPRVLSPAERAAVFARLT